LQDSFSRRPLRDEPVSDVHDDDIDRYIREVYEEGYTNLTGERWRGSDEDLYRVVDGKERGDYRWDFQPDGGGDRGCAVVCLIILIILFLVALMIYPWP
jgi:hypothetical protein